MLIERVSYKGNPNIGIYIFVNDRVAVVPKDADTRFIQAVQNILRVPVVTSSISDMEIIGIFIAGNNKGIILPHIVKESEYRAIKSVFDGNVSIIKTRFTALANICLVNDFAAYVSAAAYDEIRDAVKDVFDVEVVEKGLIADIPTVGSAAYINNIGGVIHPDASEEELRFLSNLFRIRVDVGTVNFGVGFIKSGLAGNSHGLLVGARTTGPEIMRLSKVFGGG
ncbi:MAG: translation initiation factor IF-6 [Ignisphaera sp.]|nr:translation initiation factor IF-6 [Ignisphaera sp.]MCX8168317.1 translation initiation factor IF-6 [Ignisphaera sp.]MDW8085351.1 translation initiation factor IF-6 [Ignisphaera sp.]